MTKNRTAGGVLLIVGICWLAVMPGFLCFMVSMEASAGPDRPDEATWRLWRALEVLLVEPRWLGSTLSALIMGASALGTAFVIVGVGTLRGNPQAPKWAAAAIATGIVFCGIGLAVHWAILMPVVSVSENSEVVRASWDLNLAIPVALGGGFVSMVVAVFLLLGARRQRLSKGKQSSKT
jgi:hypothetical protein